MTLCKPKLDLRGLHGQLPSLEQTEAEIRAEWSKLLGPWRTIKRWLKCFFRGHRFHPPLILPPHAPDTLGYIFVTCVMCGQVRSIPVKMEFQLLSGRPVQGLPS